MEKDCVHDRQARDLAAAGHAEHGTRCDCLLLAAAAHAGKASIPYAYCRHVLQKRYAMTCTHGETTPWPAVRRGPEAWDEYGDMDAVKAILLANA